MMSETFTWQVFRLKLCLLKASLLFNFESAAIKFDRSLKPVFIVTSFLVKMAAPENSGDYTLTFCILWVEECWTDDNSPGNFAMTLFCFS